MNIVILINEFKTICKKKKIIAEVLYICILLMQIRLTFAFKSWISDYLNLRFKYYTK